MKISSAARTDLCVIFELSSADLYHIRMKLLPFLLRFDENITE
jgi:hypothetical protein